MYGITPFPFSPSPLQPSPLSLLLRRAEEFSNLPIHFSILPASSISLPFSLVYIYNSQGKKKMEQDFVGGGREGSEYAAGLRFDFVFLKFMLPRKRKEESLSHRGSCRSWGF